MINLPLHQILLTAMDNAREGITIADMQLRDNPLIYVNKGFLMMTGYGNEEALGINCRYLQGADTDRSIVASIREAIADQQPIQVEIINYNKEGKPFWNYLSLTPIFNEEKVLTHYIGIQEDITEKKRLKERKDALKELHLVTEAILEGQEKERVEIGKELHDNVTQMIATLGLYINMAKDGNDNRDEMLATAKSLTDQLLKTVRQVSHRLVGPAFDEATLADALNELLATLRPALPFKINFSHDGLEEAVMTDKQKVTLYRIVQEQLNNILKYANANNVSVIVSVKHETVALTILDDGIGFNPSEKKKGIGLRNIANRIDQAQGSFHIESAPGKGCALIVSIPAKKSFA